MHLCEFKEFKGSCRFKLLFMKQTKISHIFWYGGQIFLLSGFIMSKQMFMQILRLLLYSVMNIAVFTVLLFVEKG